jgi:hypothetical protein
MAAEIFTARIEAGPGALQTARLEAGKIVPIIDYLTEPPSVRFVVCHPENEEGLDEKDKVEVHYIQTLKRSDASETPMCDPKILEKSIKTKEHREVEVENGKPHTTVYKDENGDFFKLIIRNAGPDSTENESPWSPANN